MADITEDERDTRAIEKVLGEPVMLDLSDATLKARRNLLAFATIAIAFAYWKLALASNPTVFGVQLQNLSSTVLAWGLLWSLVYLQVHFLWLSIMRFASGV